MSTRQARDARYASDARASRDAQRSRGTRSSRSTRETRNTRVANRVRDAGVTQGVRDAQERSSAHDKARRSQERSESRHDRMDSLRGWIGKHRRLLLALAAVAVVAWALVSPIRGYYVARRENEELQAYYEQLSDESASLDQDVKSLTSEDGIKDEARKRGYVGEGETSVEVEGLPEDDDSSSSTSGEDARSDLTKFLDTLFGYTPKNFS